jgi:hypothetical protein
MNQKDPNYMCTFYIVYCYESYFIICGFTITNSGTIENGMTSSATTYNTIGRQNQHMFQVHSNLEYYSNISKGLFAALLVVEVVVLGVGCGGTV